MNIAKLKQIWHAKDLRNDILFVLGILLIYRILAHIPIPGVDVAGLKNYLAGNQILGLLNIFTGGGLSNFSLVMLGLGPYITSSIIFQLLTMVIPQIEELSKEGERGQQKINQWTRYATVPLAILQSYATIALISRTGQGAGAIVSSMTNFELITAIISVTAGTVFLMWLGELISEKKSATGLLFLSLQVSSQPFRKRLFRLGAIFQQIPERLQNISCFSQSPLSPLPQLCLSLKENEQFRSLMQGRLSARAFTEDQKRIFHCA